MCWSDAKTLPRCSHGLLLISHIPLALDLHCSDTVWHQYFTQEIWRSQPSRKRSSSRIEVAACFKWGQLQVLTSFVMRLFPSHSWIAFPNCTCDMLIACTVQQKNGATGLHMQPLLCSNWRANEVLRGGKCTLHSAQHFSHVFIRWSLLLCSVMQRPLDWMRAARAVASLALWHSSKM